MMLDDDNGILRLMRDELLRALIYKVKMLDDENDSFEDKSTPEILS